jgi:hypothetical protein
MWLPRAGTQAGAAKKKEWSELRLNDADCHNSGKPDSDQDGLALGPT